MSSFEIGSAGDRLGEEPGVGSDIRGLATMAVVTLATGILAFALFTISSAQPFLLTLLALFAVLGVFFAFAFAAGHIQIGHRMTEANVAKAVTSELGDALLLTKADGAAYWANQTMADLIGRTGVGELDALETALGHDTRVSEAMFRLHRSAREGVTRQEDIDVQLTSNALGDQQLVKTVRVSVAPFVIAGAERDPGQLRLWRVVDISEQRAREHHAIASLEDMLTHFDEMPVGVMFVLSDGKIAQSNHTMKKWLAITQEQDHLAKPLMLNDVASNDSAEVVMGMASKKENGQVGLDLDLIRDDGTLLPIHAFCHPNRAGDDGFILTALLRQDEDETDIASESGGIRFARFFRNAPFGIATVGADGTISSTNAAFSRMIVDGTSGVGERVTDVLSRRADEATRSKIEDALSQVLAGRGNIPPVEVTTGTKSEFARRVYLSPLTHANQTREAAILYMIDVTEQKALEAKFAQSQKMDAVGKLAGFVAHDFNNMLTAIIGFSDFLLQTHRPTDPAHADIMNIKSSASRAAGLVGKLLALARQQTLVVEPLQLSDVMTDLSPLLKRSIGEKIELKLVAGRDLWSVKTDKLQLEQAIINLAVNARDAMPDGGQLTIRTSNVTERESQRLQIPGMAVGEYVLIDVEDSGTGMPPETLSKIFEPFFTTKAAGKGTGLGLATVYGIVKQTGGFIVPESTTGKGTSFRIYLPRYHLDEADESAIQEKAEAKKKVQSADLTGQGRVLLVEDEDVVRSFAVRALSRQGYEVLEAADGIEALDIMDEQQGKIDIVVSDVVMPEMDGPTMLKEMRKSNPNLKIIFVSGYPNEAFQQSVGEETFDFLPKPFSLPQLAAKVKDVLAK